MSDHFSGGDRTLIAQVPLGHIATLYAKTGDLFAWLCVAGVLAAAAIAFLPRA
jgi:apolipoprotein N-acyltransferase